MNRSSPGVALRRESVAGNLVAGNLVAGESVLGTPTPAPSGPPRTGWNDMLDELDRQRDALASAAAELAALTARTSSADRLVTVTVDARGVLVDLQIAQAAMRRYRGSQLAELIAGLVADADSGLRGRRAELLTATVHSSPDCSLLARLSGCGLGAGSVRRGAPQGWR